VLQPMPTFPGAISYPRQPLARDRWLQPLLIITLLLNLMDATLTLFAVRAELAVEANPLMDELLGHGPVLFMVGKLVMVSLGVLLLWRLRHTMMATVGLLAAFVAYTLTCLWHLHGLGYL